VEFDHFNTQLPEFRVVLERIRAHLFQRGHVVLITDAMVCSGRIRGAPARPLTDEVRGIAGRPDRDHTGVELAGQPLTRPRRVKGQLPHASPTHRLAEVAVEDYGPVGRENSACIRGHWRIARQALAVVEPSARERSSIVVISAHRDMQALGEVTRDCRLERECRAIHEDDGLRREGSGVTTQPLNWWRLQDGRGHGANLQNGLPAHRADAAITSGPIAGGTGTFVLYTSLAPLQESRMPSG
jgi:hypothetical protein